MARFTKGYSYAFQAVGFYCWKHRDKKFPDQITIAEADAQLAEGAYNKLWSDLSETDRKVMHANAEN